MSLSGDKGVAQFKKKCKNGTPYLVYLINATLADEDGHSKVLYAVADVEYDVEESIALALWQLTA